MFELIHTGFIKSESNNWPGKKQICVLVAVITVAVVMFLLHVQLKSLLGLGKCCYVFIITGIMRKSDSCFYRVHATQLQKRKRLDCLLFAFKATLFPARLASYLPMMLCTLLSITLFNKQCYVLSFSVFLSFQLLLTRWFIFK